MEPYAELLEQELIKMKYSRILLDPENFPSVAI